jgi:serine/threonine protein kinase/WD40 repeat protein
MEPSEREVAVFNVARRLPASERSTYLDEACAGDNLLRQHVEELLLANEEVGEFLQDPAPGTQRREGVSPVLSTVMSPVEKAGDRIGRYKLLQQIGEGGCGAVYMAEQEEPVRRRVALKVIKLGMDTKQVVARFEAERQALALMDHPNIAKVLDAGATDTGRPYFVMELVRGIKITEYCDENNLPTLDRLGLFILVCQAIQHAHQKGIIHRDIKPSNILVTINDGIAVPKVIDFGIAKATQGRLTDSTLFTAFEQFIGTPAYMSPEQAVMTSLDVDTRSDTYSLGVLLYELLTGHTPFDIQDLLASGLEKMRRTIREQEPPRPSTRLSTMLQGELTTTAQRRQIEPLKLIHLVRGDLDWIVMKCLEKDRSRRYETANGLAMEVQRYLDDEPVIARPPSRFYRFQKLVQRNRLAAAAAAVAIGSLIAALGASTLAAFRFQRAGLEVRMAKDEAVEKLRASYLAEARAERFSGHAGQRFVSLEAVNKAAAIRPGLDARNEAIACLAVSDVRLVKQAPLHTTKRDPQVRFDARLEQYAADEGQGRITIRAVVDDREIMRLAAPDLEVAWIFGFSPDRRFLAAGYANDTVWVWDLTTQEPALRDLPGHRGGDFSPDSSIFALSAPDGDLWFHGLLPGRQTRRLAMKERFALLAFDPKGARLACATFVEPSLQIREVESGRVLSTSPIDPGYVAWSPDGNLLATGCWDGNVYLWDPRDCRKVATLEGHTKPLMSVAFNHAGDLLASSSSGDDLRLWNPITGRQIVNFEGCAYGLHFSLDDKRLAVLQQDSQLAVLALAKSSEYRRLFAAAMGRDRSGPDFSPDGRLIAAGTGDRVCFWDTVSGHEVGFVQVGPCDSVLFSPDGKSLITAERAGLYSRPFQRLADPSRCAYQLAAPRLLYGAPDPREAALCVDGRHLALAANHLTGESVILDLQNPSATVVLRSHPLVDYIAISPDARWAATASYQNSTVRIWDAKSGELVGRLEMPARSRLTFSPDGRWLATFSADYQLWEVGTWRRRNVPIPGHSFAHRTTLAFSPDTSVTAIVLGGRKIRLIETLTARPLADLEAPEVADIVSLRFSTDGTQLAALEESQRLQLWDLRRIRLQLAQAKLDWSLPPYAPAPPALPRGPATLDVDLGVESSPFATPELARTIPPRDAAAKTNLIDLTSYYNASLIAHSDLGANPLKDLPRGVHTLAGTQFDVRGLIQVGAESPTGRRYPNQVNGIALRCTCQCLDFLHGAIWLAGATNGTRIGSYIIHYTNERRAEVPIVVGESLTAEFTPAPNNPARFAIAWGGRDSERTQEGIVTYLFKSTWHNPFPNDEIACIDFVSNPPGPAPYLVAITASP